MTSIRCPFCGLDSDESSFRQLRGSWRFRFYTVRMLECPRCRGVFNYYEGTSSRGKHSVFVIRVRPRSRR